VAITIGEQGGMNPAPTTQSPAPALEAAKLAPRLAEYRMLLRKDRRRRYLGLAAVGIGLLWLALAALVYFDAGFPLGLPIGAGLTLLLPALALLYEGIRQPTAFDTARTLDALLDNRQRVLTSVELLDEVRKGKDEGNYELRITNYGEEGQSEIQDLKSEMERAQLSSTARLLGGVEPRALYPARVPTPQLAIAGGLLVVALGVWLLKGANDDFALATGGLPPGIDAAGVVATPTADAGLPPGETPSESLFPEGEQPEGLQPSSPPGAPSGEGGQSDADATTPSVSADVAQQQADDSREAEKSLQRLSRALDEQGVTQSIADNLRQGDYDAAGDALSELGDNSDQLSDEAKDALAQSLESAASDSASTPDLQQAERDAANALRSGTYGEIKEALDALSEAVKETGDTVIPQDDLAKNFPDQPATNPAPSDQAGQEGQPDPNSESQSGEEEGSQPGESSQQGEGQSQSGSDQPGANGSPGENGEGGAPTNATGGEPGTATNQGQGSGAGDPGLPGEGSRVDGPRGKDLDAAGDPFELEGDNKASPNNLRPGSGEEPPAMTLEGEAGNSGKSTSPSQSGPVDATGETFPAPIDRWGILQRYFSSERR
jgi:hypothetical protein